MTGRRALTTRLGAVVGAAVVIACLTFVGRRLADEWPAARAAAADASWSWLVLAAVAAVAGLVLTGVGWQRVLAALGRQVPARRAVAWYFAGEVGKYVPGSVWSVLGRAELARRGGVPRVVAYQSVALSLALTYLAAAVLGGWLLGGFVALIGLAGAAAALHPAVVGTALRVLRERTGRPIELVVPPLRTSLALVAVYLPAWLAIGGATWAVARALDPGAPFVPVVLATAAGWLAGILAVPVPSGVGVREAAFIATVSGLAPGVAAATAVVARVLFLFVDGLGAAVSAATLPRPGAPVIDTQPIPRTGDPLGP
jgi:glycosyltransferase 2 family protein